MCRNHVVLEDRSLFSLSLGNMDVDSCLKSGLRCLIVVVRTPKSLRFFVFVSRVDRCIDDPHVIRVASAVLHFS